MLSLVHLVCPTGQVIHSVSLCLNPFLFLFYHHLRLALSPQVYLAQAIFIVLNYQIHHPICPFPSHMLSLIDPGSGVLPLSLTFCWSAAQSNYLEMPHCKAHSISTIASLIPNHTAHTLDTVSRLVTSFLFRKYSAKSPLLRKQNYNAGLTATRHW